MNSPRESIERSADRIRDELLQTLDELERRFERATDVRYQLQSHRVLATSVAAAAAMGAFGWLGFKLYRRRHRPLNSRRLTRLPEQRAGVGRMLLRRVALPLTTALVTRWIRGQVSPGRVEVQALPG